MLKLLKRIKIFLKPPTVLDVYYGDPLWFVLTSRFEQIIHRTKDKYGNTVWSVIPSEHAYRFTIKSDSMPYYLCKAEVLATDMDGKKEWLSRSVDRRIPKDKFHKMIIDGVIEKL